MRKTPFLYILVLIAFLANTFGPLPLVQAQLTSPTGGEFRLPAPGVRVGLSPEFNPPILKGLKVHPDNPFRFDFILDQGDSPSLVKEGVRGSLKQEATKLIKYFLASLTIPEKDLWVNLSPYEKDRIIPQSFGLTEMGRDLLAEDYMLKQITASLIYPEDEIGKKFWKRIYEEAAKKFGTTNIPVNTFNKVWIVPEKAVVYENAKAGTAYVVESKLKVMLEQDYLSMQKHAYVQVPDINALGSQIVREIVIPELTKEVNENKNFTQLRQVYNSLILATWYKKKIKDSILAQVYADKNKVAGVGYKSSTDIEAIYQRYLQAFKKGVYNYIKEEPDPMTQEIIPRKYFSGGVDFAMTNNSTTMNGINGVMDVTDKPSTLPSNLDSSRLVDVSASVNVTGLTDHAIASGSDKSEVTMESRALNMNGEISTINVVKKLTFSPAHEIQEADFEYDEWGQVSVVRIVSGKKDGMSASKNFDLGEGRIFNFSYQNGIPKIWIDQDNGLWLFTGYQVIEKGQYGSEKYYRVTVKNFGGIPALESDRHSAMYYFLKILSQKIPNIKIINFDLHHDNVFFKGLRKGMILNNFLNLANWIRKAKEQKLVQEVFWVTPSWYSPDEDIAEAKYRGVIDHIKNIDDLQLAQGSYVATIDFDYISSLGPPLERKANKEQVDADVERIMAFLGGIKKSMVGINFNRSAFAWHGDNYSPQESSAYIMNALVSKANKLLGEAYQIKVKGYLSPRLAEKVHADVAMISSRISRTILPIFLSLFLSSCASLMQEPLQPNNIPNELRNSPMVSFLGHAHAHPVLAMSLGNTLQGYRKLRKLRGSANEIDQVTKKDILETNETYRSNIVSLKEGILQGINYIGVEFDPNEWQGHLESGKYMDKHLPEILTRMGYKREDIKQLSDDIELYIYGPVAYLVLKNDPIMLNVNVIPLEDENVKKKGLDIIFLVNSKLRDLIEIERPDLLNGRHINPDLLPMRIKNLMNYAEDIFSGKELHQRKKIVLDAFSDEGKPIAKAYLEQMEELPKSIKEQNKIIVRVIAHTKGRIVVVIGSAHVDGLRRLLQMKGIGDSAQLVSESKPADRAMNITTPMEFTHTEAVEFFNSLIVSKETANQAAYGLIRVNLKNHHVLMSVSSSPDIFHNDLIKIAHQTGGYSDDNDRREWISLNLGWNSEGHLNSVSLALPTMKNPGSDYSLPMLKFLGSSKGQVASDFKDEEYQKGIREELIEIYALFYEIALKHGINPEKVEALLPAWKMERNSFRSLDTIVNDLKEIDNRGGIDLTSDKTLQVINDGQNGINFKIDPAMLKQLQNAPGFVPVIISVKPLGDLQGFLGIVNQTQ